MNKIIAWFAGAKAADAFTKLTGFLEHKKCYALGALAIIQGIVGLWTQVGGMNDLSGLIELVRHGSSDPNVQSIWMGAALCAGKAAVVKSAVPEAEHAPNAQEGPQ